MGVSVEMGYIYHVQNVTVQMMMIKNMGVYNVGPLELAVLGHALTMYLLVGVDCFVYLIRATYGLPLIAHSVITHPAEESLS